MNSTALLVGFAERKQTVDATLFADTGGELPSTYDLVDRMSDWCEEHGLPRIITVRATQKTYQNLEDNCLKQKMLPSLAYGFKSCSHKYKKQPQEKWANNWQEARITWDMGGKITKFLGIDIGETRRAKIPEDAKYRYRYPLIEWGWDRDDCLKAIDRAGITGVGRSACFFCPASKKKEIFALRDEHPELLQRALEMEDNAELTSVKGLGRSFSWRKLLEADRRQLRLFTDLQTDSPCGCWDGEE